MKAPRTDARPDEEAGASTQPHDASVFTVADSAIGARDGGDPAADASRPRADGGPGAPFADDGGVLGDDDGTTATPAASFLDSLGVCTHIGQGIDEPTKSATAMQYAGLRNLRDDGRPAAVAGWLQMNESAGVRVCPLPASTVADTLAIAKQLRQANALLALEGPNEPNNFPIKYEGATSDSQKTFVPVAHFQRDLYAAVHAEPTLAGIPVFHSSEAGGSEPDNVGLQFLTIPSGAKTAMPDGTKYADYANVHNYVCGHTGKLVDNVSWNASDPTLNGDWDGLYVEYGTTWAKHFAGYGNDALETLPRVTTETGWLTKGTGSITQEQQARVLLDLYLAAFVRGFRYTFVYMLRDDPNQGSWGLFDVSYAPKKSGEYLHNLTTVLGDSGARVPGKLMFSIANPPSTVHWLLLQKSTGVFELVLWDEKWSGGNDEVTVDFVRTRAALRVYDPTTGAGAMRTLTAVQTVPLTLSDHPVVIEYDPRAAP